MPTPFKVCANCGVENATEKSSCSSCGYTFPSPECVQETFSEPVSSQERSPSSRRRPLLTRRNVVFGLGSASLLAALSTPLLVKGVSVLFASHGQEATIATISLEHAFLLGLAWSPDGKKLVACDDTGTLRIWNVANPLTASKSILSINAVARGIIQLFTLPDTQGETIPVVNALTWSPNGKYIAVASDVASIIDATTGTLVRALGSAKNNESIARIAWSPDGRYLATARSNGTNQKGNTRIQIWATNGWIEVRQLAGEYDTCSSIAWNRDSKRLLVAGDISTNPTLQSNVQIWEVETATPLHLQKVDYPGGASGAVWSPDGTFFVVGTGEKNGSVLHVYTTAGTLQATYASSDQSPLVAMTWSPSNRIVAVFGPSAGDANMVIYQWNALTGQILSTTTSSEDASSGGWDQYQFVWSPDGTQVAYTEVSYVVVWRP